MRKTIAILSLLFSALILFYAGRLSVKESPASVIAPTNESYPLLSKRIFIEDPNEVRLNFNPLRKQLRDYMQSNNLQGSLYFEYLPTGTSIRVDGDEEEVAASLIKLPAAMELYKAAEMGKVDLDQKITMQQAWLDPNFGDLYKRGFGYEITARELVKIMLTDSDNTALRAVAATTQGLVPFDEGPFTFLDVDFRQNEDFTVSISARSYSSFLKCLYFSCYLNKDSSQELLAFLSESSFDNRLAAGIEDKDIKIAHKIGNFSQINQSDCGIVYVDKNNYVLCVMVNGADDATTDGHIAAISKLAYEYVIKGKTTE